jgi:hypothetical protein
MIFLRLALVSAAIYVAFAIAIEVAFLVIARTRGVWGFYAPKAGWFVLFGVLWLVSFWIAWRTSPLANLHLHR